MNMIEKIQSLFGIGDLKGDKSEKVIKVTKKIYFKNGNWNIRNCNVSTTSQINEGSILSSLLGEASVEFFQITEVVLTTEEFEKIFKCEYTDPDSNNFSWTDVTPQGNIKITLGSFVPEEYLTRIAKAVLKKVGSKKHLTPAHPSWIFTKDGINLLMSSKKLPLSNEVLIRAGKDIGGKPTTFFDKTIRLFVCPSTGTAEGDGRIMVTKHFGKGYTGLIRGMFSWNGKLSLIKGRMLSTDMFLDLPSGELLPEGCDGWTTVDNIKWLDKKNLETLVGKIVEIPIFYGVKDEDHKLQEFGYKFHSLAIILMRMTSETRDRMISDFRAYWNRLIQKIKNLSVEAMVNDLKDETNGFVLSSQAVKCFLGLGTREDILSVKQTYTKKFLARKIKGSEYPMIIFAKEFGGVKITPDSPVWSPALFKRLSKNGRVTEVTLSRYPLVSHQSYLRLYLEQTVVHCDLGIDYVVLHPDCAAYIQGDEDDHALVQSEYMSEFRPSSGEKVEVVKPEFRTGETDEVLAYFKGAKSQGSIGAAFNTMLKAKVMGNSVTFTEAAMAINSFAQGVKKDAILPEASSLLSMGSGFKKFASKSLDFDVNLVGLITSKNYPDVFANYGHFLGFDLSFPFPEITTQKEDKKYKSDIKNFVQAKLMMKEMESYLAKKVGFYSSKDLKDCIRKDASLWSAGDFEKVALFFLEYAKMAEGFRGYTFHRQSGLLASQLEGKYLAIYTLLKG